jgi:hypothetical protein
MNDSIDIKDLSVADILSSLKRLKLGSIIWVVSSIVVVIVAVFGAGAASKIGKSKDPLFIQHFTEDFVDREHLVLLLPEIMEESPDGIETDAEAMASLLWQLKSQDGYAQFLKDSEFFSVQVTHDGDSFNFEWDRGASAIPKILNRLSLPIDEDSIAQLNAELNLIGVAWLPGSDQIVRDVDGGLALVGKQ